MINTIELTTVDGDAFDSLLPRHEQIYDFSQLKTGKTLARVVFSLIYFGSELGQIQMEMGNNTNTLSPSEGVRVETGDGDFVYPGSHPAGTRSGPSPGPSSGPPTDIVSREQTPSIARKPTTVKPNEQYWVRVRATKRRELSTAQINGEYTYRMLPSSLIHICAFHLSCIRVYASNLPSSLFATSSSIYLTSLYYLYVLFITLSELKELEDDPEMLIEYSLKLASTYLGIPIFRFKGITSPPNLSIMCLLVRLPLSF